MLLNKRLNPKKLSTAVNMLRVIAHPTRLAIVDLLNKNPQMNGLEIQTALNLEQAVVSQHLSLMENKGIIASQKIGRNKFVSLRFPAIYDIVLCLENCCQKSKTTT